MGIGVDELAELRDELIRARARGIRTVEYGGKRITYTADDEMAAAIADLGARIDANNRRPRAAAVLFTSSKGV